MRFKKNVLLGIAATLISMPLITHAADLVTKNNSARPSTVKVNFVCVGTLPGPLRVVTPAGGSSSVSESNVDQICGGKKKHKCMADIHMTENCSDAAVAKAYFDLDTFTVERIDKTPGVPYTFAWSKTNVTINPA